MIHDTDDDRLDAIKFHSASIGDVFFRRQFLKMMNYGVEFFLQKNLFTILSWSLEKDSTTFYETERRLSGKELSINK